MKNRNIPYYAAALLMAAGLSTSMVSCVDTDEPESIALLRQAKANEVNAKASLINAQASQVLSNIDLEKATRAITDQGLVLENKKAEIENAKNELENAKTKLANALKAAKDSIELDSLKAQKLWKEKIAVANAEAQYEKANAALENAKTKALVDIEAAKNDLLKKQKEIAVELAKINKWGLNNELKDAAQALADSTADEAKKLKALQNAVKNFLTNREDIEDELDDANEIVETLKANKADFEAAIAQNDLADWLKKYWELQDIIDKNEPTQNSLNYQIEQKTDELNAVYDEAWKTNLSELAITQYDEKIEIGSEELESLLEVDKTKNLKIEDGILQYKKDDITLTYAYKDESASPDSLIAKDELKDDYKILSGQLTTIISDLKQNIEKVASDAGKHDKTDTDWAKNTLDSKKDGYYKDWETKKAAYNKADDKTKSGSAYRELAAACNDFFGVAPADPSDPNDKGQYNDFIITTSLPTYDEVVELFGGDTDEADNFYYKCGSVFANANKILADNAKLNNYEIALEAAQKLKKTLDECDFGDAELEEAEAADEALWTEDAQKIQDEIDKLQADLDKLTPTVKNAKDLQETILGFAIKANLAFIDDKGTTEEDDDELDFADYTFDGGDPSDPNSVTDKDFKEAYDFTVKTYQEDIELAEEYAAALKELLADFDKKGEEGNNIDFENGCDDIEDFFGTDEWAKMIKKVTDAQEEYDDAKNATKKAQDAYDVLKSVYLVEQKN